MIIHHNGAGLVDQSWFPARVHDGSGYGTPSKWLIIWFLNRGPILTTYPHRPGMISSKKINQHQLPTSRSCCPTEVQSLLVSPCLPSNASAWAALWRDPPKVWLKVLHQQSDGWSTYPPSTNPYQKVGPKWFSLDKAALKKPLFLLGGSGRGGGRLTDVKVQSFQIWPHPLRPRRLNLGLVFRIVALSTDAFQQVWSMKHPSLFRQID